MRHRAPGQGLIIAAPAEPSAIDVHTHYVPKGWPDLGPGTPTLSIETEADAVIMLGGREFRRIQADCWDAGTRLADMDSDGIGAQVVSPTPVFFSYAADVTQAVRIARVMNDLALEICAPAPGLSSMQWIVEPTGMFRTVSQGSQLGRRGRTSARTRAGAKG